MEKVEEKNMSRNSTLAFQPSSVNFKLLEVGKKQDTKPNRVLKCIKTSMFASVQCHLGAKNDLFEDFDNYQFTSDGNDISAEGFLK